MLLPPFYNWEDWGLKRRNNFKWQNRDPNPSDFQAHPLIRRFNDLGKETSLVVQWLGHCDSIARAWVWSLVGRLRSHMLHKLCYQNKKRNRILVVFCLFLQVNSLQGTPFVLNSGCPSLMIHLFFFFSPNWRIIALNVTLVSAAHSNQS